MEPQDIEQKAQRKDGHLKSKLMEADETERGLQLPREIESGPVEYKRSLVSPTLERLNHLTSQLKWRLREGHGEALYEIGVEDDGTALGLSASDLQSSLQNLAEMARRLNAEISVLCERQGKEGKVVEMLVRELREDKYSDVRIAVCGALGSGKSTLIGVLCFGQLDDGDGFVRVDCFKHPHELISGQTSSITQEIMGFDKKGVCINYSNLNDLSWGDIIERSHKIISFFDLAGHERYFKTTISGLTGTMPDYCILVIDAQTGVTKTTVDHYKLAKALDCIVIIVVTHTDVASPTKLKQTLSEITNKLHVPMLFHVENQEDLILLLKALETNQEVHPVFCISCVTGSNLDLFRKFLNGAPSHQEWDLLQHLPTEVFIDDTYDIPGVGTIVAGTVSEGKVATGTEMLLGPSIDGSFSKVTITSIHRQRVPVNNVTAGGHAAFALQGVEKKDTRKGMVLIDINADTSAQAVWTFEAAVVVSRNFQLNAEPVVQCRTIRQSAKIVSISDRDQINSSGGDCCTVCFKFLYRPEYLKVGLRVIFRETAGKGIGIITAIKLPEFENMKFIRDKSPLKRVYSKDSPEFLKDGKIRERQASRKKSKEGKNSPIKDEPDSPSRDLSRSGDAIVIELSKCETPTSPSSKSPPRKRIQVQVQDFGKSEFIVIETPPPKFNDKQKTKPTCDLGRSGELIITDPPKIEATVDTTQVERRDLSKSGSSMAISEDEDSTKQEIALETTIEEPKTDGSL